MSRIAKAALVASLLAFGPPTEADDREPLTRILRAVILSRSAPGSFTFSEATAVAVPNTDAQVSVQRVGGTVGAFQLFYSFGGSGCTLGGTFGPIGSGDGDAATRTIAVPMAASGVCTVILNPPSAPGGFGPNTGISSANPPRLVNIATRGRVQAGDNVMIAGFIIEGSGPRTVVVRARGPSLTALGVPGAVP